jgi:serine/threonine-protein kinase
MRELVSVKAYLEGIMRSNYLALRLLALAISAIILTTGCGEEETPTATPAATRPPEALTATAAAAQPSETPTAQPTTGLLTHDSPDYGIRIKYPADWTKDEQIMGAVVVFFAPTEGPSDIFQENVNIIVQDLSAQPMTLDEYTELSLGQIEQFITDPSILDSSAVTLADIPGHRVVYTGKQGQYDLKWMQVWTVQNNKAYVISYTAETSKYSTFLGTAQEMIDSFEIS